LCRWPNGDCSVVVAESRDAAIELLDNEIGNAEGVPLHPLKALLVNLRLTEEGRLELDAENPLGSDMRDEILSKAYPELHATLNRLSEVPNLGPQLAQDEIKEAVAAERVRIRGAQVVAGSSEGRRLQKVADVPATKADRIARDVRSNKRRG
jgi:hypothetical protein